MENDYIAYNRDYNNKVWEQLRMKQLNEIPIRQRKRRPIKRYRTNDFSTRSERDTYYTCICNDIYLVPFILFLVCFLHYT
jgi:hypothetical protein